jgi:mono/diheme cytochrome c family protein
MNRRTAWIFGAMLAMGCDAASPSADEAPGGSDGEPPEFGEMSEGETLYRTRVGDGNTFACETCHALSEPADDGLRRAGHPIGDAAARATYKNGELRELREAVNSCLVEWMNAEPWSADDERWVALSEFLEGLAPPSGADDVRFEIVAPPSAEVLASGDPVAGRETFNATCATCHAKDGGGSLLAPPIAGLGLDPEYIARRVRTSGRSESAVYDGLTGGVMPFWSAERMSDTELADIATWLAGSEPAPPAPPPDDDGDTGDTGDGGGDDEDPLPGNCASTHPRIGQTAELQELFHGVGGTAEILDDCTLEIRDFTYDGNGIDVRLYGGLNGDYDAGFPIGDQLIKRGGYSGETLTFTLPQGRTFDELHGVSVWCVAAGVDFGSGTFE